MDPVQLLVMQQGPDTSFGVIFWLFTLQPGSVCLVRWPQPACWEAAGVASGGAPGNATELQEAKAHSYQPASSQQASPAPRGITPVAVSSRISLMVTWNCWIAVLDLGAKSVSASHFWDEKSSNGIHNGFQVLLYRLGTREGLFQKNPCWFNITHYRRGSRIVVLDTSCEWFYGALQCYTRYIAGSVAYKSKNLSRGFP